MPSANDKSVRAFLDDIPNAKLKNFASSEKTLVLDKDNGFRLDHQGLNQDGSGTHRLLIQPLGKRGGGKSGVSQLPSGKVIAQIHVTEPGNPEKVRDALWDSYKDEARLRTLV